MDSESNLAFCRSVSECGLFYFDVSSFRAGGLASGAKEKGCIAGINGAQLSVQ